MNASSSRFSMLAMLFGLGSVLLGCAPTIVPSSGPRPATTADVVELYQYAPSKFEVLGTVKTDGTFAWEQVGQMQGVIDELKAKAAALGANGLLLQVPEYRLKATGTYNEENYQVPIDRTPTRNAMATAIYVYKK